MHKKSKLSRMLMMHALLSLFLINVCYSQTIPDSPLILSWDKLGCQSDTISKANFDDHLNDADTPCLKVCEKSLVTYRISGSKADSIDSILWTVTGGVKEDLVDRLSMPITWDNTPTGSLEIKVFYLDGSTFEQTICIQKLSSVLTFSWDKIGCQMNKNNVNEVKVDNNFSNLGCFRVCEESNMTYKVSGDNAQNISTILWTITGGTTTSPNDRSCKIQWNNTAYGSIQFSIVFNNGTTLTKLICVEKIKSSLVLDWDKIDESAVRQIKFDNSPDNPESILAYPDSTVLYKLDGKQIGNVESINWIVTGGYAYTPNSLATLVTWDDGDGNSIQIIVSYSNGTTLTKNISIVSKNPPNGGPGSGAVNSINFKYDDSGNQRLRGVVFLAKHSNSDNPIKSGNLQSSKNEYTKSDLYPDISYFPNPVKSELHIKWSNKTKSVKTIEIYDLNGKMVKNIPLPEDINNADIDFESYPNGVYNLNLIYTNSETKILKIVKQ